ncbi:hypothetical protein ACIBSV_09700 [Embleya sp. NPDC050154]|uniref:hypothetical protein n=1 Tax=Embleya sp. NPDC050154 TaxID=3363988 RepID=UPI0037BAB930
MAAYLRGPPAEQADGAVAGDGLVERKGLGELVERKGSGEREAEGFGGLFERPGFGAADAARGEVGGGEWGVPTESTATPCQRVPASALVRTRL